MLEEAPGMKDDDREEEISRSWSRNAGAWTRAVREQRIESRRGATDAAIVQCVLANTPARVLDVGCGEGWLARALATEGVEVVGFDGSQALVDEARREGGATFFTMQYGDFENDPEVVGTGFDTVVCNFSLFGAEIQGILRGCERVLSVGGHLHIQTVHPLGFGEGQPYADGWREEDFRTLGGGFRAVMPWYFRTFARWIAELAAAGLILDEVREPVLPGAGRPASLILTGRRSRTEAR